jgi:signal transduction histidine kinase
MAESLRLAAESLCAFGGFGAVAISVVRDAHIVTIVVAGAERVLDRTGASVDVGAVLGTSAPLSVLEEHLLPHADRWGLLHYLPHDRVQGPQIAWRVDREYDGTEWHPDDMLLAPVADDTGRLRGLISLDGPVDGRLPGPEQRVLLERYVAQAARILVTALDREELSERLRLLDVAREALRQAAGTASPQQALEEAAPGLIAGFGLVNLRATVFDRSEAEPADELLRRMSRIDRESSEELWRTQAVAVLGRSQVVNEHGSEEDRAIVRQYLESMDLESVLLVPMGAGQTCLGSLVFSRAVGAPPWSVPERRVAQDVGRDLGRLIADTYALQREQRLVQELRELDTLKRDLLATVSHELQTPVASILSNAELIGSTDDEDDVRHAVAAMERGARRMSSLVNELLLLARLDQADRTLEGAVLDLAPIVEEVVALHRPTAEARGVDLEVAGERATTVGDAGELTALVGNLVSNAVKYSGSGDTVHVGVAAQDGEVAFTVTDHGIGIHAQDRTRLFEEFRRGTDPEALSRPGTGLGLAIVDRIVRRHGGRVEVESSPGAGSTFRVFLPVAAPD